MVTGMFSSDVNDVGEGSIRSRSDAPTPDCVSGAEEKERAILASTQAHLLSL